MGINRGGGAFHFNLQAGNSLRDKATMYFTELIALDYGKVTSREKLSTSL